MRTGFVVTVIGTLASAVVSVTLLDDLRWEAATLLFWLIVIAAALCVVTAVALARLSFRLDQVELAAVATFFFGASVFPLVHGLTIPGVLYGPNEATMSSIFLAVPAGTIGAVSVLLAARSGDTSRSWRRALIGSTAIMTVVSSSLLVWPQVRLHPIPGSDLAIVACLTMFAATVALGWRHVRLAEIAERPGPMVVSVGYLLVGGSVLVFLGASPWSTYFWLAHAIDVIGVFLATIGAVVVYWRHDSVFSMLAPVTVLEPRRAFEYGLSPVVHRFVADLDAKDRSTRDHVVRTSALAIDVARELGLPPDDVRCSGLVGLLHDVGKLEIPDEVLTKPGKLTDDEFTVIKSHAAIGAGLLAETEALADLAPAVRAHHERIDGSGYPDRLAGDDIPLVSRIVAACDAFDAMSFTRHYRAGLAAADVRATLQKHAGTQWDERVVEAVLTVVDERSDEAVWALDGVGRRDEFDDERANPLGCDCVPRLPASA